MIPKITEKKIISNKIIYPKNKPTTVNIKPKDKPITRTKP